MPILARPPRILSETDRATGTLPVAIRGGPALAARVGGLPGVAVVAEAAEAAVLIAEAPVPEAEAPVLVLAEGPAALTALRLGARGVVSPDAAPAMLEAALRAVARGLSVLPPPALVGLTGRAVAEPPGALTPREREVLDLLAAIFDHQAVLSDTFALSQTLIDDLYRAVITDQPAVLLRSLRAIEALWQVRPSTVKGMCQVSC